MHSSVEDRSALRLAKARRLERRQADQRKRAIRARFYAFAAVLAIIAVAPRFFPEPGVRGDGIDHPPPELVGRWTTTDSLYADRSLEIQEGVVAIGMGPGLREWYPILSTRLWAEQGYTAYVITYESIEGDEMEIEVHLQSDGTLRLRNPSQMIWTKMELTGRIS